MNSKHKRSKGNKEVVYLSIRTGKFVSKDYAHKHPKNAKPLTDKKDVIIAGLRQLNESTEKQISEIDRIIVKYGLYEDSRRVSGVH